MDHTSIHVEMYMSFIIHVLFKPSFSRHIITFQTRISVNVSIKILF